MSGARRFGLSVLLAGSAIGAAACATRPDPARTGATDPKLSSSTFIEEGDLVALLAGTRPMRARLKEPYLPLEVAVVNKSLEKLSLTRESFTLVTADGKRYSAASRETLVKGQGASTDFDRRLGETARVVASRFASYALVPSNLTPGFDQPFAIDRLFLPRFSYISDFLYFPRPEPSAFDAPVELFVDAPELDDPVFVRFELPRPGKGRRP